LTREKTAQLFTQGRREHGYSTLHKVNACCPLTGIPIQRSVSFDEERNICNVYANIISAIIVCLDGKSVIDIFSSFRIDAE
jgi:hypothetical protein